METPADHPARQRFTQEIHQPFSVIAPAGVGKTYAIIERAANMLLNTSHEVALVTYTKKAAEEMRQRLESRLRRHKQPLPAHRIFVGTIHALCLHLMNRHSLEWQLPATAEVFPSLDDLWNRFIQETPNPFSALPVPVQDRYYRHFGRLGTHLLAQVEPLSAADVFTEPPAFDFSKLFKAEVKGPAQKTLERLKSWAQDFAALPPYVSVSALPRPPAATSALFPLYNEVFGPYLQWKSREGLFYIRTLAQQFRAWRMTTGAYLYDDLIEIVIAHAPANYGLSIILDEAQDTSPRQLILLQKLAALEDNKLQLTLVGDPQQSIYSSRASLPHYLATHRQLISQHGAQELTFQVTFRCPTGVIHAVNHLGPALLDGQGQQAQFVPLLPRPQPVEGSVARMTLPAPHFDEDAAVDDRDWAFARAFAGEFSSLNIPHAQAHTIAILAPRREWLFKLADTLTAVGFRVQVHADAGSPSPARRILHSLVHLLVHPFDSFELVGLLRELSPASDLELAALAKNNPAALTLVTAPVPADLAPNIFATLSELYAARQESLTLPLPYALADFIARAGIDDKVRTLAGVLPGELWQAWLDEKLLVLSLATEADDASALLRSMADARSEAPVEVGALQLMTMHKAKGLEWARVFLPFLHRPLNAKPPQYPALDAETGGLTWSANLPKLFAAEEENFRRLLYVALTRSREDLIFVDDHAFYPPDKSSCAHLLGFTGVFREFFHQLPAASSFHISGDPLSPLPAPAVSSLTHFPSLIPFVTPSSLVSPQHLPAEVSQPQLPTAGLDYGEWWHQLWQRAVAQRPAHLAEFLKSQIPPASFAPRATDELKKLQASAFWTQLVAHLSSAQAEVPFLARVGDTILEGRIDLLITHPDRLTIIDWKTDRLSPDRLVEVYAAQLAAYAQAFHSLSHLPVATYIYSTAHGTLLSPAADKIDAPRNI